MADDSNKINNNPIFNPAAAQSSLPGSNSNTFSGASQVEFLTLLVNQLKNQDPLNPMDNQEFAVQLAQFSQLEQLININSKLDGLNSPQTTNVGMLASFLGHEVVLDEEMTFVRDGNGANVMLQVPEGSQSLRIDIVNNANVVIKSLNFEELTPGRQTFPLKNLEIEDGQYTIKAKAVNAEGSFVDLDPKITGTVEGFVMEPEPALIVNGLTIPLSLVSQVFSNSPSTTSS